MGKKYKAIVNMKGVDTVIDCTPDVAIDGQKVMLVKKTGERIIGHVSGRDLGTMETVVGVGRVKDGAVSIDTGSEIVSVKIQSITPRHVGAFSTAGLKRVKPHDGAKVGKTKVMKMYKKRKATIQGLAIKAIKE